MKSSNWRAKGGKELVNSTMEMTTPLDSEGQPRTEWTARVYEVSDLLTERSFQEEGLFLLNFKLKRIGLENSGINQTPVTPPLLLSLKAEGKELALFSGLLGRHMKIEEAFTRNFASQAKFWEDLQRLREEVKTLEEENELLKHTLGTLQRPRRIS